MGVYLYGCPDNSKMLDKVSWDSDVFDTVLKYADNRDYFCLSTDDIQKLIDDLLELGSKGQGLAKALNHLMLENLETEYFIFTLA